MQLINALGQPVKGRLERQTSEADLLFDQPLSVGLYWLVVETNGQMRTVNVLVQ